LTKKIQNKYYINTIDYIDYDTLHGATKTRSSGVLLRHAMISNHNIILSYNCLLVISYCFIDNVDTFINH